MKLLPPTRTREKTRAPPLSLRISDELLQWVKKAAYRQGMTPSAFLRFAARDMADRVLGYERDFKRTRRPPRNPAIDDE